MKIVNNNLFNNKLRKMKKKIIIFLMRYECRLPSTSDNSVIHVRYDNKKKKYLISIICSIDNVVE